MKQVKVSHAARGLSRQVGTALRRLAGRRDDARGHDASPSARTAETPAAAPRPASGVRTLALLLMAAAFATLVAAVGTSLLAAPLPVRSGSLPAAQFVAGHALNAVDARAAFEAEVRRVRRAEAPLATLALSSPTVH